MGSILLAVDESRHSSKAVDYVKKNMPKDSRVTILSILPDATAACGLDSPSLTPLFNENRQAFCTLEDAKRNKIKEFAEGAKETLVTAGFEKADVAVRIRKKKSGIARDILKEIEQGDYDTVVLGRRGLSGIKEFVFGSVTSKVLEKADNVAVIVVD